MNTPLFTRRKFLIALQAGAVCLGLGGAAAFVLSPKGKGNVRVESLEREIAQGNRTSAFVLAMMYAKGDQIPKDEAKAVALLQRLAKAGDAPAMSRLAIWTAQGRAVPRDMAKAEAWAQKAADGADGEGMRFLAMCHLEGQGVPKDEAKAMVCADRAADAGDVPAMLFLASRFAGNNPASAYLYYRVAEGVTTDAEERRAGAAGAAKMAKLLTPEDAGKLDALAGTTQRKIKDLQAKAVWDGATGKLPPE